MNLIKQLGIILIATIALNVNAQHWSVENIAGNGTQGYGGEGGPAVDATVGATWGITEDGSGNILFCDLSNGRVRRIDANTNNVTTLAGTTAFGSFNGDGIPATSAELGLPAGIATDSQGNIYFSDLIHHRIRKIDVGTGLITTVVGTGSTGYNGDYGQGDTTTISAPTQIAIDANDNLFFTDVGNYCIRKLDNTGIVTTICGVPGFSGPGTPGSIAISTYITPKGGLTIDDSGNVYFTTDNDKVLMVNTSGYVELVAGTGTPGFSGDAGLATNAKLNDPHGLHYRDGFLLIADKGNFRIRKVNLDAGTIETVVGTGNGTYNGNYLGTLQTNIDAIDAYLTPTGDILISDNGNFYLRRAYICQNPDLPTLEASNLEGCPGDTIQLSILTGDINDAEDWVWRTDCFAGDSVYSGPVFEFILNNNNETFYVRGEGRCANNIACVPISIEVSCREYHNAFSPNNDGFNDIWEIPILEYHPENEVTIFNRWGDEVMYIENYNNQDRYWDGSSYDSEVVTSGTYYFTITASDGFELKGWVQVVK